MTRQKKGCDVAFVSSLLLYFLYFGEKTYVFFVCGYLGQCGFYFYITKFDFAYFSCYFVLFFFVLIGLVHVMRINFHVACALN